MMDQAGLEGRRNQQRVKYFMNLDKLVLGAYAVKLNL